MSHRTVMVKVNALVDEGIADLVVAMNNAFNISTRDSCQGDGVSPAYVYFHAPGESVMYNMCQNMRNLMNTEQVEFSLTVAWTHESGPIGCFEVTHAQIDAARKAFVKSIIRETGKGEK